MALALSGRPLGSNLRTPGPLRNRRIGRADARRRISAGEDNMTRPIAILAACGMAVAVAAASSTVLAQASPTTQSDAQAVWEKIKGSWTTTKGAVKEQWGKLTDDDLLEIEGRREKLVGKIQARYGIPAEEAEAQVSGWERRYRSM
jgi:uncharacterized protein YjbJ (UPF0337 family)